MTFSKRMVLLLLLLATMLTTSQLAFAGGVDPELPSDPVDSRICGREGAVTQAQTIRWTDVFSTADPETQTGNAYPPNTAVTVLGRDFWGCWVKVNSADYNGWVPVNALNSRNVMDLPMLIDNSNGCSISDGSSVSCAEPAPTPTTPAPAPVVDSRICGTAGAVRDANTTRWTDTYSTADPTAQTGNGLAPQVSLTINGRDFWGCWVNVTHSGGTTWLPVDAISTRAIFDLPQMVDNSGGCTIANGQVSCP